MNPFPVPDAPLSLSELREVLDSNIEYFDELESQPDGGLDTLLAEYSSGVIGDITEYDPASEPADGQTELSSNFLTSLLQEIARRADARPVGEDYFSVPELLELGFTRTNIKRFLTDISEDENYKGVRPVTRELIQAKGKPSRDPDRYYSIDEVTLAMSNPALVEWLKKTHEARAKAPKDTNRMVSQAVGAMITMDFSPYSLKRRQNDGTISKGIVRGGKVVAETPLDASGKVPLLQVMTRAVADWNKLYSQIVPKELHGVIDEFNEKHKHVPSRQLMTPLFAHFPKTDIVMMNRVQVITVRTIRDVLTNYKHVSGAFARRQASKETGLILRMKTAKLITDVYPELTQAVRWVFLSQKENAWDGLTKANVRSYRISDDIRAELQVLLKAK